MTRALGRLSVLLPAAVGPAVVLAVDPGGWYPFGPFRWMVVTVLLLASATTVLASPSRTHRSGPRSTFLPPVLVGASLVLVAAMVVAAVVGVDGIYAWTGTPERNAGVAMWILCVVALFVGASSARGHPVGESPVTPASEGEHRGLPEHGLRDGPGIGDGEEPAGASDASRPARTWRASPGTSIVAGWVVAGAILGITATAEALGWEPTVFDVGTRLTGLMGSSAYLGAAAALLLPVAVGALSTWRMGGDLAGTGWFRAVSGAAVVGLVVALVGSGARAAWLGVTVATVVVGSARRDRMVRLVRSSRTPIVVAATVAGLALITVVAATSPAADRAAALFDADAPGGAGRLDEWRVASRVLARHRVTGVGPEGYRIAFAEGVDIAYETRHGRDPLPDRAHSGPLDLALAGGPMALAAWLVVWSVVGRAAWWAMRAGSRVEVGVAAGLVAHWVGQLALFPLAEVEPVAWLMAGWLVARWAGAVVRTGSAMGSSSTTMSSAVASIPLVSTKVEVGLAVTGGHLACQELAHGCVPREPRSSLVSFDAPTAGSMYRRIGAAVVGLLTVVALVAGAAGVASNRQAQRAAAVPLGSGTGQAEAERVVDAAERAVELRPDFVRHHLLLAQVRVVSGQGVVAAIAAVDDALAVSPRDPIARLAKARYLLDRAIATEVPAHAADARRQVWSILADDPLHTEAWALAVVVAAIDGAAATG